MDIQTDTKLQSFTMIYSDYPTFSFRLLWRAMYNAYRLAWIGCRSIFRVAFSKSWAYYKDAIAIIEKHLGTEGKTLSKQEKKRFFLYTIVASGLLGVIAETIVGKKLKNEERKLIQFFTILTAVFDDLVDDYAYSEVEMTQVCQKNIQREHNIWEKIAYELAKEIEKTSAYPLWNPLTEKIVKYQALSQAQISGALDETTLREITYEKGGVSIQLSIHFLKNTSVSEKELEGFYWFGVLLQLTNDVYDVFKDRNSGTHTLATDVKDIRLLRKEYDEVVNKIAIIFTHLPYNQHDIHDFLLEILVIASRGWVAFDHLEAAQTTTNHIFEPNAYTRPQLITDMAKWRNIWRSLVYNLTAI